MRDLTSGASIAVNAKSFYKTGQPIIQRALLAVAAVVITLLLLELIVRLAGQETADGQFIFAGIELQPYALPLGRLAEQVQEYEDNLDRVTLVYDELFGWKYRPNSLRQGGEFTINGAGLRSQREYELQPPADTLRIALFGDSFTAGDDATDEQVWSHLLEVNLNQSGIRAEVLNFGVSAYGMDQAYLRWLHDGGDYAPDIVVLGLQAENLDRNVNIFRQLIHPQGPAFSKPRFDLSDEVMTLINSPAIPPDQLVETFAAFASHPLSAHEAYYRSRDYARKWWPSSRLASLLYAAVNQQLETEAVRYGPESERGRLGKAIVEAFAADVLAADKAFIIAFLPHKDFFERKFYGRETPYQYLLDFFRDTYHYFSLADHVDSEIKSLKNWGPTLHYGPELNSLMAELLSAEIAACIESAACPLARFDDINAIYAPAALAGE